MCISTWNADEGCQLYRNALQVLTDSKSMPLDDNVMEKMIDLPELLHLVGRSKKLQVFDVSMNRLNGEIPLSISNCNALKFLDLGFNSLNGSIPIEVVGLKRLLVFRLGNNSVDGTVPAGFGSIELLEVLDLHNLKLVGNIPEEISNCKFLLQL
ncbi:unnamed protein product [Camellia sinensis]